MQGDEFTWIEIFIFKRGAIIQMMPIKLFVQINHKVKKNKSYVSKLPHAFVFRCAFDSAKFKV